MSYLTRIPIERVNSQFGFGETNLKFAIIDISDDGGLVFLSAQFPSNSTYVITYDVAANAFVNAYATQSTVVGHHTNVSDGGLMTLQYDYHSLGTVVVGSVPDEKSTVESRVISKNASGFDFYGRVGAISDNGRYAIIQTPDDATTENRPGWDKYLLDLSSGKFELLPRGDYGALADVSESISISDLGTVVLYDGKVHNRATGEMIVPIGGTLAKWNAEFELINLVLAGDGRYVFGTGHYAGQAHPELNYVYRYDLQTGMSEAVFPFKSAGPAYPTRVEEKWSTSDDGRYVSLMVPDNSIQANDLNNFWDIYVRDMATGKVTHVSAGENGQLLNGNTYSARLSGDGRAMVFESEATNIQGGGGKTNPQIYIIDGLGLWLGPDTPGGGDVPTHISSIALLYEAGFAREADVGGLNYWIDVYEGGMDLVTMAGLMLDSDEFTQRFGDDDAMTASHFVNVMYANVLDRPGETAGIDYWVGQMNAGSTREAILLNFAASPENVEASTVGSLVEPSPGYWTFG